MSILVVGSVALDTVKTPLGRVEEVLGGSASYFSVAASFFAPVHLVAVVGQDFEESHARIFRERPQDLQPVVRARLEVGFGISAYDYLQAQRLRATLTRAFVRDVFGEVDVLMTPVIPEPQPALAALKATAVDEFNARAGRFSGLTRPFNGLGLPAISVPCGFGSTGLPLAFQLVGRPFAEALLLRLGHAYQENTGWPARQPELG